ncbi:VWA domain-containing protein [Pseudenhygromyxa sp. WMMC2535]|uniref:VIT domain-containing protein n=1 Tax=Pseudenhygromyxa sp. WMMC2535 TaxID=2712867 RepID=UPI001552269F|nr:VIT domain-containing protein [Pseudenhygromyxa sp. WMMC2535]NVB36915.1 VWA domain-containing protein [Pseudenhygromyxa sp. WMMC2535]
MSKQDAKPTDDLDAELEAMAERELAATESEPPPARLGGLEKLKILGAFVIVGLFAVGGLFAYRAMHRNPAPERTEDISAKLELAAGEVLLLAGEGQSEGEGQAERLLSGTPLPSRATLRTGTDARALVRLADGSRVFLRDDTQLKLGEDAGVELLAGELWLEVPPLDANRQPATHRAGPAEVVLSDGGADLSVGEDRGARIYVAKGVATVSSEQGRAEVRTGERATVASDGAAPVVEPEPFWDDWTGGMADRSAGGRVGGGSGALYAVDDAAPPGTPALPLSIAQQIVDVAIEDELAETRVDQRFYNPSERPVEGWYWFTIPEGAMLVGFELETDGELVKGEIVERQQAAATYASAKVSNDNPALLEWIDARTVRAKIYPVPAMGERRIVVRYQQRLDEQDDKLRYTYPLAAPAELETPAIEEFALAVELRGDLAKRYAVSTLGEASVSGDNRLVSMRRSGFVPRADFELELTRKHDGAHADAPALRLSEYQAGGDKARFVMLRWRPEVDFQAIETPRADVVVVVDTSAFGDDAEHQSRVAVAEALLRSLSADDHFAVVAADLGAEVLYPAQGLSPATKEEVDAALAALTSHRHGGATDLGAIFERALNRVQAAEQPAVVYIGDGLATSGERGADALSERLRRALTGSRARLFTVGVGPAVDDRLLARLARVGGGESLRVEAPEQAVVRALELSGAIKTPTLTDLELELGAGLDDRFDNATGKLARGRELVILARTHADLPKEVSLRYRLGGQDYAPDPIPLVRERSVLDFVIPKLWAAARIERLLGDGRGPQAVRGKVLALGLEYGLMTPFTSFLALDSERAYARKGIERRDRPWDRQLLGDALPHTREITGAAETLDGPEVGELLLGALSAPMGCYMAADEAPASEAAPLEREEARQRGPSVTEQSLRADDDMGKDEMAAPAAAPEPESAKPTGGSGFIEEGAEIGAAAGEAMPSDIPGGVAGGAPGSLPGLIGEGASEAYGSRAKGRAKKSRSPIEEEREPAEPSFDFEDDLAEANVALAPPPATKQDISKSTAVVDTRRKIALPERPSEARRWQPLENHRPPQSEIARNQTLPCSDASSRPLSQRKVLWEDRLARAPDMRQRLTAYEAAAAACELDSWRHQRVYLDLLQASAQTEAEIQLLIAHFWEEAEAKAFVVKALQRRLVDPQLIHALERALFGASVDLGSLADAVATAKTDAEALALVRDALERYQSVPPAERLHLDLIHLDLLYAMGRLDEAIAAGRKLRERNLMTPALAERLGELLVAKGEEDEAKRVYSEIVEYDPESASTRRLLGDIFLRHAWYQEAYRQYGDLVALSGAPEDTIRLAKAAAGAGRVDEALRLLRQVSMGDGRPGVDDPRRWARLHAAALLAQMLAAPEGLPADKLARELKRLQLFDAPTTWTFLLWRDLDQQLTMGLSAQPEATASSAAAERASALTRGGLWAGETGLWAVQRGGLGELAVRHRGEIPPRAVSFERVEIRWDGETFSVETDAGTIPARAARERERDQDQNQDQDSGDATPE